MAEIFRETADNEKEHAKRFFKFLPGGIVEYTAAFPAGVIAATAENLQAAAAGEHEEWAKLYPQAAQVARAEGFDEVAEAFEKIAQVEAAHERRYLKLWDNLKNGQVFKKAASVKWKCRNCGYLHTGPTAPDTCPACRHPQIYFELAMENY